MKSKVIVLAAGVLFALRLLEPGDGWGSELDALRHRESPERSPASSKRLQQLETWYAQGAISEREYRARRLEIISGS